MEIECGSDVLERRREEKEIVIFSLRAT